MSPEKTSIKSLKALDQETGTSTNGSSIPPIGRRINAREIGLSGEETELGEGGETRPFGVLREFIII